MRRRRRWIWITLVSVLGLLGGLLLTRPSQASPPRRVPAAVTPIPTPWRVFLPLAQESDDGGSTPEPTPEPIPDSTAPEPLPDICYTTDSLTARKECVLAPGTTYAMTLSKGSDLYLAFPITHTLHVSVTDYSRSTADVDMRLWGENSQGLNVPGPFHPGPTGGPNLATWSPTDPYVVPGTYLVEPFSATGFTFTAQLTVEDRHD